MLQKNEQGLPYEINKSDVVKLVKEAWHVSFAREETNRKAVLQRGWGPRALNYNVLLHPEILPSKPQNSGQPITENLVISSLPATHLNLSNGLAGTLIDRIVIEKNKESRVMNPAEAREKHCATAKKSLENHEKRCSAGLIAAAGQFSLDEDVLAYVRHTKEQEEARVRQQQAKKKDIYDILKEKVKVIKNKNLPPEKWTVPELNTMLQWYKNLSDTAMPTKKAEKIARYYQICNREDPPEPELQPLPPLAFMQAQANSSNDDESQSELIMFNDNSNSKSNEQGDDVMMRTEV